TVTLQAPLALPPPPILLALPSPESLKPIPSHVYTPDGKVHTMTFVYDAGGRTDISNLTLMGSWDANSGRYSTEWNKSSVPMHQDAQGRWVATVPLLDDAEHPWQWGVTADGPTGKGQWAIFDEGNLDFSLQGPQQQTYTPTATHLMGVHQDGKDATFRFWAPNARTVGVKLWRGQDKPVLVQMAKDPASGMWSTRVPDGWKTWQGASYAYQIQTSDGDTTLHDDPYGLLRQGPQLGISDLYLHPVTGQEVNQYYVDPDLQKQNKPSWVRFEHFELQGHPHAQDVSVVFTDDHGKVLGKDALMQRLGQADDSLVGKYHQGSFNDYWAQHVDDQGRIHLTKQGNAWATVLNNPQMLAGLHYHFEIAENGS
ncbi:MAG: early set domain-containing protein, partial [Candidatus Xenobia bacterium]